MLLPLLFAAIAVGLVGLAKADKATSGSSSSGDGTVPLPAPPVGPAALSCAGAIAGLPEPLKSTVGTALAYGTDPLKLEEAAKALDSVAATYPQYAPYAAGAAACLRQKAATLAPPAKWSPPPAVPSIPSVPGVPGSPSLPSLPGLPTSPVDFGLPSTPEYSATYAPIEPAPAPLDLTAITEQKIGV